MGKEYLKKSRTILLLVLVVFAASASGFAESIAQAEHNAWSKCRHTQQRIERGKVCPCGCNKQAKPSLRITNEHADCGADDVVAHAPSFSQLDILFTTAAHLEPALACVVIPVHYSAACSLPRPPDTKPG